MGILDDWFGSGGAGKDLDHIPDVAHGAYDPYISRGAEAGGILSGQFGGMAQDPTAFINKIMEGYKPSKGYQMQSDAMHQAAANSAAAGGMRGSESDVGHQAQITDRLMGQDMQNWLQNALGVQRTGMQGEQGLYGTGFQASSGLAGDLSNYYGTKAGLDFHGAQDRRKMLEDALGGAFGAATGAGIPGL